MPLLARLERPFAVHQRQATFNDEAQFGGSYPDSGLTVLALVGSAQPGQTITYGEVEHTVTHALTARGPAYANAKPGDLLIGPDGRSYFVLGIENPDLLGRWTVFFTELRRDLP